MYKVIFTKRAKIELENAYNYIYFNLVNPIAAKRFRIQIIKSISILELFPFMGKKYNQTNFRYIKFKNYLIFYSVNSNNIEILRIIHKRQNLNTKI